MEDLELDALLRAYFRSWRPYRVILACLKILHGVKRSMRWLKYQFERLGLQRRKQRSLTPVAVVRNCIQHLLLQSGSLLGYRAAWKVLREKYGVNVKRSTVMFLLQQMDPDGVHKRAKHKMRRRVYISKGPNHVWHVDQYDKLSKYGFCIHGCIDGFSRKVLWLKVAATNRNPAVTVGYFIEAIRELQGCPQVVRMDRGTENCRIAQLQVALRMYHGDNFACKKSIQYGSSPANSRIESWWSRLRCQKVDWWIQHFRTLERDGWLDICSTRHKKCLAFAFLPILQHELKEYVVLWNTHTIRPSALAACPNGRPDDMFDMPQLFAGRNCKQPVMNQVLLHAEQMLVQRPPLYYDRHFHNVCSALTWYKFRLCISNNLSPSSCTKIYKHLIQFLP